MSCSDWHNRARTEILKHQKSDGSWPPVDKWSEDGGPVYATAMNALTLLSRPVFGGGR